MPPQIDSLGVPGLRSRQGSASPARTHHHLANSPMAPRYTYTPRGRSIDLNAESDDLLYTNGPGEEDWTRVASEVYGSSVSLAAGVSGHGYEYTSARASRRSSRERYSRDVSPHYLHTQLRGTYAAYESPPPQKPIKEPEKIHPCTPPFCAPEILRDECEDPILADAYSLGIVILSMDLGDLVRIEAWKQKKEDGTFPEIHLSRTKLFTDLIRGYTAKAPVRFRIEHRLKMDLPPKGHGEDESEGEDDW